MATKKTHSEDSSEKDNGVQATPKPTTETPAKKEPKERTFVDAKTGKAVAHPHQGGSSPEANKVVRDEIHTERKGNALPFRIGAIVLWVLGIGCEVVAVLVMNRTLFLPGPTPMTWLIIWLVIDLVLVVIGSQLWKKANHISPASKDNKLAYWVQTDLGVIVAAIAFAPIIILMLTSKNTDKRTKKVGTIVAALALVVAVGSGIDYHPTTQEDFDEAQAGAAILSDDGLAYWTPFGSVYHFNPDCQYLKNSGTIYSGTLPDALDAGRDRGCSGCTVENGTDVLSTSDPEAIAAAAANAISVIAGGDQTKDNNTPDGKDADNDEKDALPKAA